MQQGLVEAGPARGTLTAESVVSIAAAQRMAGVSRTTLRAWINGGELAVVGAGARGAKLVRITDVVARRDRESSPTEKQRRRQRVAARDELRREGWRPLREAERRFEITLTVLQRLIADGVIETKEGRGRWTQRETLIHEPTLRMVLGTWIETCPGCEQRAPTGCRQHAECAGRVGALSGAALEGLKRYRETAACLVAADKQNRSLVDLREAAEQVGRSYVRVASVVRKLDLGVVVEAAFGKRLLSPEDVDQVERHIAAARMAQFWADIDTAARWHEARFDNPEAAARWHEARSGTTAWWGLRAAEISRRRGGDGPGPRSPFRDPILADRLWDLWWTKKLPEVAIAKQLSREFQRPISRDQVWRHLQKLRKISPSGVS